MHGKEAHGFLDGGMGYDTPRFVSTYGTVTSNVKNKVLSALILSQLHNTT